MKLIDADLLAARVIMKDVQPVNAILNLIQEMPEADAIVVTRCKDCIAFQRKENGQTYCRHSGRIEPGENGYCERGTKLSEVTKRRTN